MWFMKKVDNVPQKRDKIWFTLNKKLNHFLFEYFYEHRVIGKAEDWSCNVWNMNHISLFQKKECGL